MLFTMQPRSPHIILRKCGIQSLRSRHDRLLDELDLARGSDADGSELPAACLQEEYPKTVHQLKSAPDPSSSPASRATLTNKEIRDLAELKPGFVERLDREKVASMDTLRLARLQRLVGWRLIPHAVKFSKMQAILQLWLAPRPCVLQRVLQHS